MATSLTDTCPQFLVGLATNSLLVFISLRNGGWAFVPGCLPLGPVSWTRQEMELIPEQQGIKTFNMSHGPLSGPPRLLCATVASVECKAVICSPLEISISLALQKSMSLNVWFIIPTHHVWSLLRDHLDNAVKKFLVIYAMFWSWRCYIYCKLLYKL